HGEHSAGCRLVRWETSKSNRWLADHRFQGGSARLKASMPYMIVKKLAYILSTVFMLGSARAQEVTERPNFLLLLSDDMTYHDLGSYGNQDVHTPNLDRLA